MINYYRFKKNVFFIRGLVFSTILFLYSFSFAQLTVNITTTPANLVNNLVGNGVSVFNISYTGHAQARGIFNANAAPVIGLKSGVLLATGMGTNATGPNNDPLGGSCYVTDIYKSTDFARPGDSDLNNVQGCPLCTQDAAILEFDFIPESSPLSFRYVFASEEYPCYVCSKFNDVFAFFLSGPNPAGGNYNKKNIATIPNTTIPVAINSVNSGTPGYDPVAGAYYPKSDCISTGYSSYFVNNGDGSTPTINKTVQYNGFTKILTATADVVPCKTYHIKLAIADVGDGKYDSAVLLEENSFKSASASMSTNYSKPGVDTLATVEGCNDANVCFKIDKALTQDYIIPLNYKGSTADSTGKDYAALPKSVTIKAGQTQVCLVVNPVFDNLSESTEKVVINAKTSACGWNSITVIIKDNSQLIATGNPLTTSICEDGSASISVNASGGFSEKSYKYTWSGGAGNTPGVTVSPKSTTTYTVTVEDECGAVAIAKVEVKVNPKPVVIISKDTSICIGGTAGLKVSGAGNSGSYLWSNGSTNSFISVSPTVNTTYTVTATTGFGCKNTGKSIVKVNPLPKVTATAQKDKLCAGEAVMLNAGGAVSFVWSSNPLDNSLKTQKTIPNPTVSPLITTTYTVEGTDANGCVNTATVVVNVKSPPITPVNDTAICAGSSAVLKVTVAGGGISYNWSTGATTPSIIVSPGVTTTYSLTVTESTFGCKTIVKAVVTVNPLPNASAGNDKSICIGANTNLTATGGGANGKYSWSSGQKTATINVNPSSTTNYTVTVSDAIGCSSTASVKVTVNTNPVVDAGKDVSICEGFSANLSASCPQAISFKWSDGQTSQAINVTPASTTNYSVTVTDANGCTGSDQLTVTVNPNPVPSGQDKEICNGANAVLSVSGAGNGGAYEWNTGDKTSSITVSPQNTTNYSVTLTNSFGCKASATLKVTVHQNPVAVLPPGYAICKGDNTNITASGAGVNGSYKWSNGNNGPSITVSPTSNTSYSVTVTDQYSCTDNTSITISVNPLPPAYAGKDTSVCNGFSAFLHAKGGIKYEWSNGEKTPDISVAPSATTNYTVTVTDANNCSAFDQVIVTVNQQPVPTGQDREICFGGSAVLTAGGAGQGGFYEWNTGEKSASINVSPQTTTNYTVTLTNVFGCVAIATLKVTVHPNPVAVLPPNYEICKGNKTTITASGAGNNGNYKWNTGDNLPSITVSPAANTTYIVTVIDQFTCSDTAKIVIGVNDNPTADAGKDTAICSGSTAVLNGKGGIDYLWSTGEKTADIFVKPQSTTVYYLTVTDANNCIGRGSVTVTVNPIPTSVFIITPAPICIRQTTTLTYTGTGSPGSIFKWNIDGDTTRTGPGPFQLSWDSVGNKIITLTVIDKKCVSSPTVSSIQVNALPVAQFSAVNIEGCMPLTVQFSDSSEKTNATSKYLWDFGDGKTSSEKNPVHTYNVSGRFSVSLTVSNAAFGCDDKKTIVNMIDVWPKPIAKLFVQPSNIVSELNPTVGVYSNSIGNIVSFKWTLSDNDSVYTDSAFTHTFNEVGTYRVTLEVVNNYGCVDTISGRIIVKQDFTLYIPNAFIPFKCKDEDNCRFRVKATNINFFEMRIFDRWGALVYQSNDIYEGWDGKVKGKYCQEGVYVYRIDYKDEALKAHTVFGHVTLLN